MSYPGFTAEETAAILAGLRLLQFLGSYTAGIDDIATNGGEFEMLDDAEIDDLCEKVNI